MTVTGDALVVDLLDGRTITVPLAWYPRLSHGSDTERAHWRFIGEGEGIHWPDLDEDISVEGLLAGRRSAESQASLGRVSFKSCESFWQNDLRPARMTAIIRASGVVAECRYCRTGQTTDLVIQRYSASNGSVS